MIKNQLLVITCLLTCMRLASLNAQDTTKPAPPPEQKVSLYGYVRNDVYANSRRNLDLRDGVLDVMPLDKTFDAQGKSTAIDNNDIPQLGFSAIVTRLGVKFGGIKALGADASGILETDFFGVSNGTIAGTTGGGTENLLRLRHAYANLEWKRPSGNTASLLIGQYWNPNYLINNFPGVTNFSAGIPINPFGFMPQIRFTYKFKSGLGLMGMVFGYDLAGFSPAGAFSAGTGVDATKFAFSPASELQVSYTNKSFFAVVGAEGIAVSPAARDGLDGTNFYALNLLASAKYTGKMLTVKAYANYGDLYTPYVGLGGFVGYRDSATSKNKYVATKQLNLWGEVILTASKVIQPALFVGYADNLGFNSPINVSTEVKQGSLAVYGRQIALGRMYDYLLRVAPRLDFYSGKLKLSLEYEASIANYVTSDYSATSTSFDMKANSSIADPFTAINHRLLLSMVYNF